MSLIWYIHVSLISFSIICVSSWRLASFLSFSSNCLYVCVRGVMERGLMVRGLFLLVSLLTVPTYFFRIILVIQFRTAWNAIFLWKQQLAFTVKRFYFCFMKMNLYMFLEYLNLLPFFVWRLLPPPGNKFTGQIRQGIREESSILTDIQKVKRDYSTFAQCTKTDEFRSSDICIDELTITRKDALIYQRKCSCC